MCDWRCKNKVYLDFSQLENTNTMDTHGRLSKSKNWRFYWLSTLNLSKNWVFQENPKVLLKVRVTHFLPHETNYLLNNLVFTHKKRKSWWLIVSKQIKFSKGKEAFNFKRLRWSCNAGVPTQDLRSRTIVNCTVELNFTNETQGFDNTRCSTSFTGGGDLSLGRISQHSLAPPSLPHLYSSPCTTSPSCRIRTTLSPPTTAIGTRAPEKTFYFTIGNIVA